MTSRKQRFTFIAFLMVIGLLLAGVGSNPALAAPDNQDDDGDTGEEVNPFCTAADVQHKMAARLAETYEVSYDQVKQWFCEDGYGFGQIAMALQTSKLTGDPVETLLAARAEGKGWGNIWKDKGLIRSKEDAGPPPWAGHGRPAWAGPKQERTADHPGNGNANGKGKDKDKEKGGRPCWAGNPDPLPEGCIKPTDEPEEDD
jgi:hypothetical protein